LQLRLERGGPPEGGRAAAFAETADAIIGGADVGVNAGVINFFNGLAGAADDGEKSRIDTEGIQRGKLDVPKSKAGIEEGDAVSVAAGVRAELADDADFGFLVAIREAEDELLFRGKLVVGKDARAVKAEHEGLGRLGKDPAVHLAADEENGNFFRDAEAAAHNLLWQAGGQSGVQRGTFKYSGRF
jgi:hypothetical protein